MKISLRGFQIRRIRYRRQIFDICHGSHQVILAGTLTGPQGDIRCKVLAALSTVK